MRPRFLYERRLGGDPLQSIAAPPHCVLYPDRGVFMFKIPCCCTHILIVSTEGGWVYAAILPSNGLLLVYLSVLAGHRAFSHTFV